MQQASSDSSALHQITPGGAKPVFEADKGDEAFDRWGPIFSVFAQELEAGIKALGEKVEGMDGIPEQMHAASRRYGHLLSLVCQSTGRKCPCALYDCADGVSVLITRQREPSPTMVEATMINFDNETTSIEEKTFIALLSRSIRTYFDRYIPDKYSLLTVTVDDGEYAFMRAECRDEILQKLHIGTTESVY